MGICTFPKFSGNLDFCPEKSGPFELSAGTFLDFSTFNRKKYGRRNFNPKTFAIFNFRGKNFPARKISWPKKLRISDPSTGSVLQDSRREPADPADSVCFFPTFALEFFGFFNFQPEKIRPKKFRGKKDPVVPTFEPKIFDQKNF
ncbi:MAG: hypothetical protein ABSG28_04950 [Methanoregula sp.]|jgi:hypothetical protein